ncbi:MAG: ABC transporter permease [Rhodospirillaceae bacterium]|nr:ABC transporter permease [Rhodospirillaceae bacterium]
MSSVADNAPNPPAAKAAVSDIMTALMPLLFQLRKLAWLLFTVTTLLFFLMRQAGDPALVLAGNDATPEQLAAIRAQYGLDQPLLVQYFRYMLNVLQLNFGKSLASAEPAMLKVLDMLPRTLHLAGMAILLTASIAIPLGSWLGFKPENPERRAISGLLFVMQGVPGFVTALILIQIFAVNLRLLPSLGYEPLDARTWVLPVCSLASFLVPSLTRVVAANVAEAMREDYIRTARANGASQTTLLWSHAVPNALLGAAALIGTQFAFLLGGSAIIETIFSWPGMGWLLLESVQTLDFPVVQALAFMIAIMVFTVNACTDLVFRYLDPRLRTKGS